MTWDNHNRFDQWESLECNGHGRSVSFVKWPSIRSQRPIDSVTWNCRFGAIRRFGLHTYNSIPYTLCFQYALHFRWKCEMYPSQDGHKCYLGGTFNIGFKDMLVYNIFLWIRCLTPNACWLLEIGCVVRRIFAICGVRIWFGIRPGVVLVSEN